MFAAKHVVQSVENGQIRSHLVLLQPSKTLEDFHLVCFNKLLDVRIIHHTVNMAIFVAFECFEELYTAKSGYL